MTRIRIAQRAWEGASGVDKISHRTVGVDLLWVELDGHRIEDVECASVHFADGCSVPEVTVRPYGTVEVVYLNPAGEEIASVHADPRQLVDNEYGYGSQHRRPPPADVFQAVRERDLALAEVARLQALLSAEMAARP